MADPIIKILDTGAPRGERNYWLVQVNGYEIFGMFGSRTDAPLEVKRAADALGRALGVFPIKPVAEPPAPYCAKLAGPCPDGCAGIEVQCGKPGEMHGDCWRVQAPSSSGNAGVSLVEGEPKSGETPMVPPFLKSKE